MLRETELPNREYAQDIVLLQSFMIYTNLKEFNVVGDTETTVLRCFPFFSKRKAEKIKISGQYMNYRTFSNRQFRPMLKKSLQGLDMDLKDEKKKVPVFVGITSLALMFKKSFQQSSFTWIRLQDGCLQTIRDCP